MSDDFVGDKLGRFDCMGFFPSPWKICDGYGTDAEGEAIAGV